MARSLQIPNPIDDPMRSHERPARLRRALAGMVLVAAVAVAAPLAADEERAGQENEFGVDVARRGLWKEAAYRWRRAVELDPRNARAHNNLAVGLERSGQFEEALEVYETALSLEPTNEQIRQNYELFREAYERKQRKDRDAARSRSVRGR